MEEMRSPFRFRLVDRRRRRRLTGSRRAPRSSRTVSLVLACAAVAAACERTTTSTTEQATTTERPATSASESKSVAAGEDRADAGTHKLDSAALAAAQTLDPGLNAANAALKAGRFDACRKEVAAYLARAGASAHVAHAEFVLALSYHRQRLFGEARPHFERTIALEPAYIPAYYFYGYCLFNLGALDEARQAFAKYLDAKPDEPDAIFGQGLVALEQDRVDDAERLIARAIELVEAKRAHVKNDAEARKDMARYESRLADVYLRRDDLARARAALEKAVDHWPDFFESWNKLYKVLVRLGDEAAAKKALAKYQELFERQSNARGAAR